MNSKIAYANLRAQMAREQVTIADLARIIGKDRVTISRKLSKHTTITLPEAEAIAKRLSKSIEYLFSE